MKFTDVPGAYRLKGDTLSIATKGRGQKRPADLKAGEARPPECVLKDKVA